MKTLLKITALSLLLALSGSFAVTAQAKTVSQPHMTAALKALNTALSELNQAAKDKGGYRAAAVVNVKQAIKDVNAGIAYVNKNGLSKTAASATTKSQPHMTAALAALGTAYSELNSAAHDKGGFRVKAMADVQTAMANVTAGINYANTH